MSRKTILVCGGGDWADASADLLDVPADLDIDKARQAYRSWYKEQYLPSFTGYMPAIAYVSFVEWLKQQHDVTDSTTVETWWEP